MGMSASQARYLQLTARKSDVEYQAQQIAQKRLNLAERTELISRKYTEKINDRHLYYNANYKVVAALTEDGKPKLDEKGNQIFELDYLSDSFNTKRLDYYDITNSAFDTTQPGQGLRILNADGKVVVPLPPTQEEMDEAGLKFEDYVIEPSIAVRSSAPAKDYENACNFLESKITSGEWQIQRPTYDWIESDVDEDGDGQNDKVRSVSWSDADYLDDFSIVDMLFKDNDSAAEAEYSVESAKIQQQDKALELRLNQLATEQKALDTELDSVGKVIEKNVQESFKTFG